MNSNEAERRAGRGPIPPNIQERFPVDRQPREGVSVPVNHQLLGFQQDWNEFLANPQVLPIVIALANHPGRVAQVSTGVNALRERLHSQTDERKEARYVLHAAKQERRNVGFIRRMISRIPFIKSEDIKPSTLRKEKKAIDTQIKETKGQLQTARVGIEEKIHALNDQKHQLEKQLWERKYEWAIGGDAYRAARFAFENFRDNSPFDRDRFFRRFINRQPPDFAHSSLSHYQTVRNLHLMYDAIVEEDLVSHGLKEPAKMAEPVEPEATPPKEPTIIQQPEPAEKGLDPVSLYTIRPDTLPNEEVSSTEDVLQPERPKIHKVAIQDSLRYFQYENGKLIVEEKGVLVEKRVCIGLPLEDGLFRINFTDILEMLEPAIADVFRVGRQRLTGEGMAEHFMDNFPRDIPLGVRNDGIIATLGLAGVARSSVQEEDNWRSEGVTLIAEPSRDEPDLSTSPLEISIHLVGGRKHYNRPPISDPKMIERIGKIANRFADAFGSPR